MAMKIRREDEVVIIAGKDKGKNGIVKNVLKKKKIIVSGINIVKKHQKPVPTLNKPGGIFEKELPISISNVAILNKNTNKADKIGFKFENGKKVRFLKSTGEII